MNCHYCVTRYNNYIIYIDWKTRTLLFIYLLLILPLNYTKTMSTKLSLSLNYPLSLTPLQHNLPSLRKMCSPLPYIYISPRISLEDEEISWVHFHVGIYWTLFNNVFFDGLFINLIWNGIVWFWFSVRIAQHKMLFNLLNFVLVVMSNSLYLQLWDTTYLVHLFYSWSCKILWI